MIDDRHEPGGPFRTTDRLALLAAPGPMGAALHSALADLGPAGVPPLLERLIHHRVDGIAWRSIANLPAEAVDPWLRAALRRRHQQRAAESITQGLALCESLERLDRSGLGVAVLRGLRASEWIYNDPGARPFENHDLLIRGEDETGAGAVLRRLHYDETERGRFRRANVTIDLHTDPLSVSRPGGRLRLFPIDLAALWRSARPGWVSGGPALLLPPEDELLFMALYTVRRSFDRLLRTSDLAHVLSVHGRALSWESVRDKALSLRALPILGLALGAAEALGVTVPVPVRLDPQSPGLSSLLLERVHDLKPLPYRGEILMALAAERFSDRARLLFHTLLPRRERPSSVAPPASPAEQTVALLSDASRRTGERRRAR